DPNGQKSEYFELLNTGAATADLSGWTVSRDGDTTKDWLIPAGFTLAAGEHKVVFALYQGDKIDPSYYPYALPNESSRLTVTSPDGVVLSETYPDATSQLGKSYARSPDGGSSWAWTATLTPGASNVH
ncbi:lamin tail domain-containing protein, partial [Myxococcota bacterium]|nr:lamin tail domain-containing protein [Myxococcota bacterium]